jgi:cobalt-zinc-cadmium efflux system outer membrane protein
MAMRGLLFAVLLLPGLAVAETMDFQQAQKYALFNNPSIRAAYHSISQARGRLLQAGLWPNPEIDLAYRSDVFFGGDGQDRIAAGLAQRLPWSGRLARAQTVSRLEVAIALTEVRDEERRLVQEVQGSFIDNLAAVEKTSALKRLIRSVDSLIALNEARRQAGQASAIAVNIGKVEREGLRQRLVALEADQGASLATLKGLLGLSPDAELSVKGSLTEVISALRRSTQSRKLYRPDLVRTSLEADAAGAEAALARAEAWEDITVGVEYEFERTLEDDALMNENFLGFRVAVPLPVWNRNQGTVAEKAAAQQRARETLIARQIAIEAEVNASRVRAVKSAAVAALIQRDSLPLLDETRGILESAIQTGQADTTEAITLTNQEIEQRLFFVEALVTEAQALSAVEASLGANGYLNRDIFINTLHENKSKPKKR